MESPPGEQIIADWEGRLDAAEGTGNLPVHHSHCLGCGPGNPHGHHLEVRREGDSVVATHAFDERHMGAPGIAHGGGVATVLDDLFGFLLYVPKTLAVTRKLQIEYVSPVLLGTQYEFRADLVRQDGRKLYMAASVTHQGTEVAKAEGTFIAVDIEHFTSRFKGSA